jgi:phospholipase C
LIIIIILIRETRRNPGFGMAYFNRSDLPFYYELADAYTIGD